MNSFLSNFLFVADNVGQYENKMYFNLEHGYYSIIFTALTVYGCLGTVLDWQEISLFVAKVIIFFF